MREVFYNNVYCDEVVIPGDIFSRNFIFPRKIGGYNGKG